MHYSGPAVPCFMRRSHWIAKQKGRGRSEGALPTKYAATQTARLRKRKDLESMGRGVLRGRSEQRPYSVETKRRGQPEGLSLRERMRTQPGMAVPHKAQHEQKPRRGGRSEGGLPTKYAGTETTRLRKRKERKAALLEVASRLNTPGRKQRPYVSQRYCLRTFEVKKG